MKPFLNTLWKTGDLLMFRKVTQLRSTPELNFYYAREVEANEMCIVLCKKRVNFGADDVAVMYVMMLDKCSTLAWVHPNWMTDVP